MIPIVDKGKSPILCDQCGEEIESCKKIIFVLVLFLLASCGYGQYPKLKTDHRGKIYNADFDSVKYYRYKFLEFADRMNNTHGRASARFEDSAQKYYKLLYYRKP